MPSSSKRGSDRIVIAKDGEWVDDVTIRDVAMFRMEQLDEDLVWIACYLDGNADERVVFHVRGNAGVFVSGGPE